MFLHVDVVDHVRVDVFNRQQQIAEDTLLISHDTFALALTMKIIISLTADDSMMFFE